MQDFNFYILFLAALIPLIVGFIWYSKPLFANAWMKAARVTEGDLNKGNFVLILVLTYVLSLMLSFPMMSLTIHQMSIYSVVANDPALLDPNSELSLYVAEFRKKYGSNYRTFKHGAFHGVMASLFVALPLIGIVALFERRGFKYIAIHVGYWMITLALMGGVLCAFV